MRMLCSTTYTTHCHCTVCHCHPQGHDTQFLRLEHPHPVKNQQNIIFGPTTVSDHEIVPFIHSANNLLVQPILFDFSEPVNEVEL